MATAHEATSTTLPTGEPRFFHDEAAPNVRHANRLGASEVGQLIPLARRSDALHSLSGGMTLRLLKLGLRLQARCTSGLMLLASLTQ